MKILWSSTPSIDVWRDSVLSPLHQHWFLHKSFSGSRVYLLVLSFFSLVSSPFCSKFGFGTTDCWGHLPLLSRALTFPSHQQNNIILYYRFEFSSRTFPAYSQFEQLFGIWVLAFSLFVLVINLNHLQLLSLSEWFRTPAITCSEHHGRVFHLKKFYIFVL